MKEVVQTSRGDYEFEPVHLYHGRGAIDPLVAAQNLLILKQVLDESCVGFGIIYGTLLGAVRERGFIAWDEDVDVFVLDEDRGKFHELLHELRRRGLELVRRDGDLYSLMKDDNYIDVYFFRRSFGRRICNKDSVKAAYLEKEAWIEFIGSPFRAPFDACRFLAEVYGTDWRVPKKNAPAEPWSFWTRLKEGLKRRFPILLRLKKFLFR